MSSQSIDMYSSSTEGVMELAVSLRGLVQFSLMFTYTRNVIDSLGTEQVEGKYMNVSEEPVQDATLIQNAAFEDQTEESCFSF